MPCGTDWINQIGRATIVIYADCEVHYDGRASSRAGRAWRIIIIKPDGSLLIHTNEGYQPLNWQPPGSRIYYSSNQIIAIRRSPREVLRIIIHSIEWACWGVANEGSFRLTGTHDDLKYRIANNISRYIPGARVVGVEVPINGAGVADIVAEVNGVKYVIEVKRQCAGLEAVSQLKRYTEALNARGVLVAPCFSSGARVKAREYGFRLIEEQP